MAEMTIFGATVPPPPPRAGGGPPIFPEFWTRLCSVCERLEQAKFDVNINWPTINQPANAAEMWNRPWNTCTCRKKFGNAGLLPHPRPPLAIRDGPHRPPPPPALPPPQTNPSERYCLQHHRQIYDDLKFDKEANETWPEDISRSWDGKLVWPSQSTRNRRAARGSFRACRCGADADVVNNTPEVTLCMACEGLWCHVRMGTAASRYRIPVRLRRNAPRKVKGHTQRARGQGNVKLQRRERQEMCDSRSY